MKPLTQLMTLDDLMAQAGHCAAFCFRNSGRMEPTCFLIGADSPMMPVTGQIESQWWTLAAKGTGFSALERLAQIGLGKFRGLSPTWHLKNHLTLRSFSRTEV